MCLQGRSYDGFECFTFWPFVALYVGKIQQSYELILTETKNTKR